MTSLYQLTNEYKELENMDLDPETLTDTLESIDGEFEDKVDSICHVIANMSADIEALESEINRLKARQAAIANRKTNLKDYLRDSMERLGKKKIESTKFTINCVAGRDKVNVLDLEKLPLWMFSEIPAQQKLDKKRLLEELKGGLVTEGAELSKSKSSLRIK